MNDVHFANVVHGSTRTRPGLGGVFDALASMRGPDFFQTARPTHEALRFRAGRKRGIPPLADVYLPDEPAGARSVVLVHGGGFVIGGLDIDLGIFFHSPIEPHALIIERDPLGVALRVTE